jgi:hypothetical protein
MAWKGLFQHLEMPLMDDYHEFKRAHEIPKHSFCFIVFFVIRVFWFSMFWASIIALLQKNQSFGLDVVYHSGYFYVICCECGDNDGYMHQHMNARH